LLGLTRREVEVLTLVAKGRTNRQISQALFITPKTANVHVSRILAKLASPVAGKRPRSPTDSASTSNDLPRP
jgi:ATP/maltotriose-dependent transcriptional regulator MalT